MAKGEIVARQTVLFRTEDEGNAAAPFKFLPDQRGESGERDDALFRLAIGQSPSADDQSAGGDGIREGWMLMGVFEKFRSADGGAGFAPMGLERSDDGEVRKAKVGHGSGRRANVERVAGGDEDDVEVVALVELEMLGRQEMIVLRAVI